MSQLIDDSDLEQVNTTKNDRIGARDKVELPGTGMGAVKSIFAPANRTRLILVCGGLAILVAGAAWTYYSVTASDAQSVGAGIVAGGNVRAKKNTQPSALQQEDANRYNTEGLIEKQRQDTSAHPIVVTEDEEQPFAEQRELDKPGRISDAGNTSSTHATPGAPSSNKTAAATVPSKDVQALFNSLVEAESEEPRLQSVSWTYKAPKQEVEQGRRVAAGGARQDGEAGSSGVVTGELPLKCKNPIIRAGRMYMARAVMALNSDVGGPVNVEMLSGPLRKHRLLGAFDRKEEWVRMNFTSVVGIADPKPIKAIGLDTKTALNAVSGDVDYHSLYRYGWWGVGAVLSAVGKAAQSNSNTQTYFVGDSVIQNTAADSSRELKIAAGDLGESLGDVFKDRIDRPLTVSLKVNDEVGIVFMDDVCGDK